MTLFSRFAHRLSQHRAVSTAASVVAVLGAGAFLAATPAQAATTPWWHLNTSLGPATLEPGGEGTLYVHAENVGDAPTSGAITLTATLPPGVSVLEAEAVPQVHFFSSFASGLLDFGPAGPLAGLFGVGCETAAHQVTCTTAGPATPLFVTERIAPAEYDQLEMRVGLKAQGAASAAPYEVTVSGGGAPDASVAPPLTIAAGAPPFGAETLSLVPEEEGGQIDTRAGSHPFQLTNTFNLNQTADPGQPPAMARNLRFRLPPGQLGNAIAFPKCPTAQFTQRVQIFNTCPPDSALGVASILLDEPEHLGIRLAPVPVFNLVPRSGEPARFGFMVFGIPVILDTSIRSANGEDYGVTVETHNTVEVANLISSTVTFWGNPGDPRHDAARGWGCLAGESWAAREGPPCEPGGPSAHHKTAFLTMPTNCAASFATSVDGVSWPGAQFPAVPLVPLSYSLADQAGNPLGLTACNQVPFAPRLSSEPTSDAATSPTGFNVELDVNNEGLLNPQGLAESEIKKVLVTLPQGFTTNPSVAEGLQACTRAQYESESLTSEPGAGCPNASKVGDVEIESPLVEGKVKGSLFVATQGENPYENLLTLYLVARNADLGVFIKQALKVTPDPVTGQLTTEVDNIPQLPFSHFRLSFRQGQRSPLVTPPTCDSNPSEPGDQPFTVEADLYPWSNPTVPLHDTSSFQITQGPEGQGCPSGGVPPFHPNLEAGTLNNAAGTYSPFVGKITRKDSEQEITHFSIKLPPGVIGKLAGIPFCPDAGIAAAKAREHEGGGQEELNSPSCPQASEVGHSLVGTGVGNVLAYAPGKLYLAGPYHGAPVSIVSITAAKVGPFDLGTVVVHEALKVNPETGEVFVDATGSDPIPHIVDGIPVHLRDIRVYINRPGFVLNPTSCEPTSTASTVLGSGLNFASEADDNPVTVTSPFQAADCAALPFSPRLGLKLLGATRRTGHPALKATLRMNGIGEATIGRAQVTLPKSEFLDQGHLNNICTRVQFKEAGGNGAGCPAASVYGHARASTPILSEPLEGPVYLRSSDHQLPDLVAALHGEEINVDLVGRIDSLHGQIRNTFEAVPDAPVESFTLEMQGGAKGLLINSTNLCEGTHRAIVDFTGHNGKISDSTPAVRARCAKPHKKGKGHKRHRGKRRG